MNLSLKDKKVFVSASSDGIGKAIAEAFLDEGAAVVVNGCNVEKLDKTVNELENNHPEAVIDSIAADMSEPEQIRNCCQLLKKRYGQIDAAICNLGTGKGITSDKYDLDEWNHMVKMNLFSAVSMIDEIIQQDLITIGGSICLIASLVAFDRIPAPPAYAAAKSGIVSLVNYSAPALIERGIRINAVSPGNVYYKGGRWDELQDTDPEGTKKYIETEVPMKRFCKPEEIASSVVFLCSEKSSFTTGTVLRVDGGQGRGY